MIEDNKGCAEAIAVPRRPRCLAVGSGKGGVGKTMVSVGLSMALVDMGYRVLLFDADMGLANVDLQMGLDPLFTLQDVVYGGCSLERAVISIENGPDVLASSSGAREMTTINEISREMLVDDLIRFSANYDFLIVDTEAGIGPGAITFLQAMPQVDVIVMNEPTSVMDAYSLIKILSGSVHPPEIRLVVNNVRTETEGHNLAKRMNEAASRFLGRTFGLAGIILHDPVVGDAIRARCSVVHFAPDSAPAIGLRSLARSVVEASKARNHGKPMERKAFEQISLVDACDAKVEKGGA